MARERKQCILRLLERRGSLHSASLARELGVTDETIRTDLIALQKKGLLRRIRGGAEYLLPQALDDDSLRLDVQLAQIISRHIEEGMSLIVDSAPFSCVLAAQLKKSPCSFITNSPRLINSLSPAASRHHVFCPGGWLDKGSGLIAPSAETSRTISGLSPSLAILSPPAMSPTRFFYQSSVQAAWAELAITSAKRCLVAAPSSALTASAPFSAKGRPDLLVTEDNCPKEYSGIDTITVPYISPDALHGDDAFNY